MGSGLLLFYVLFYILKKWSRSKRHVIPRLLEDHIHLPGVLLFIVISITITLPEFKSYLGKKLYENLAHACTILLIITVSYLCIKLVRLTREIILAFYNRKEYKDYTLRSARTKFQLIQRVINVVIIIVSFAAVLMTFEKVKLIGSGLLASAGVAGIVLGFAAQKSLGTLFSGIQIAISQPVKIDDIVVVEGQYGTIGEITLTYVVLNTWDEKRLIVPINYFLENSFENWTRASPEVLGRVKIYTDYTLPVEPVRQEFLRLVATSTLWDQRKAALDVTEANEKTILLRATMSAKDSEDAFRLECFIREKMITFILENYPESLPTSRLNIKSSANPEFHKSDV